MKRYTILCEETCPVCDGKKRNLNGPYGSFTQWCRECDGTGIKTSRVELSEALKELHKTPHVEVL